jgi:ADP-heptose:LPS heptosyltransferase
VIKFLIIRFSSIGDIVLTTPVIRCLSEQIKDAEIHYLTKPQFAEILQPNPYISKIHVLKENFIDTIDELKNEFFDYIIDLHNNIRTFRVKRSLCLPAFSFRKLNYEKWMMVNFKINKLPGIHIVDRYFETLDVFDVINDNIGLDYFISDKDEINISEISPQLAGGFIAFVIGAKHNTKRLPVEKISSICKNSGLPVILLGGKEDEIFGDQISGLSEGNVFNCCGKFNISRSASVVRQANVIITHDTGLMHIAAAFHKKIISVWGNTIPSFGMFPYNAGPDSKIVEVNGLKCRPCTKIGFTKCPEKHFRCMKDIDENYIISLAKELFKKGNDWKGY